MNEIEKLAELFAQFPGIGPRQARRFVYFLLRNNDTYRKSLAHLITDIKKNVQQCSSCFRHSTMKGAQKVCRHCDDTKRDPTKLMIIEKDTDIDAMEKSGTYKGKYLVLGGTIKLTGKKQPHIREKELLTRLTGDKDVKEIILAFPATADGEYTTDYLRTKLPDAITVTVLGRGLSTGSELEYADSETLRNAFKNRA